MRVTLTLMPAAMVALIAGNPSRVAGILISTSSRPTRSWRSRACAMVASVSWARPGSTSIETRPSLPFVARYVSAKRSHASRTSVVVSCLIASATSTPCVRRVASCSSYAFPWPIAASKIVGFVVTPTTE